MELTLEERLKRRKLDALRRGVHRVGGEAIVPFNVHMVGIGKAGAAIVANALRSLQPSDVQTAALVIDIGDADLEDVREAAASVPKGRADVDIIALDPISVGELSNTFQDYEKLLKLEYPMYPWKFGEKGWLPESGAVETPEGNFRRAYAKALYGRAYYDGSRTLAGALRKFGGHVNRESAQPIVSVVFGMGGGTGSGIVVDLARHLTNVVLGRRALVVGLGILPCDGDVPQHRGGGLFAALNEFDCLGDETKNRGVVASCGELFRNPFTAGLLLVPQQHIWKSTHDLAKTHFRVDAEVASLLTERGGANLMETLRMLNWVAAPSTQHSAARTPWGAKWIHMFGFSDLEGDVVPSATGFRESLGIGETYKPEFIEVRVPSPEQNIVANAVAGLEAVFSPDIPPQVTGFGRPASAQFVLPSIQKTDLALFKKTLDIYGQEDRDEKLLDHSLLLDQGILVSEPSDRLEGMAGASLDGTDSWIAVPLDNLIAS